MTVDIAVPQLNPKQKTAKDAVISILSQEWPLSAKEIYSRMQKQLALNVSYQAVHKILKQLDENNVIFKSGLKYELDRTWIADTKKHFTNLEKLYNKDNIVYEIDKNFNGTIKWQFDDFSVLVVTCAEILANNILGGNDDTITFAWLRHLYWPLRFNFTDFAILQRIAKNCEDTYVIASSTSPFDKWIQRQYLRAGVGHVKIGIEKMLFDESLMVQGDGILQVSSSLESKQILDKIYNRNKNLTDLFKEVYFRNMLKTPLRFDVTITRDPSMARFLKQALLRYFR